MTIQINDVLPNGATVLAVANGVVLAKSGHKAEFITWRVHNDDPASTTLGHYHMAFMEDYPGQALQAALDDFNERAGLVQKPSKLDEMLDWMEDERTIGDLLREAEAV